MPLDTPTNPTTALSYFSSRETVPSIRNTAQWYRVSADVRAASYFSATVEDARFLDRSKSLIEDFLAENVEQTPGGPALKVGSRADFLRQMREFMVEEGMVDPEEFGDQDDLTNLAGQRRLDLIFDTQVRQAHGYARHTQGMEPEILAQFPAQKFVRIGPRDEPRPRHAASEGDIRARTDFEYWADYQNAEEIGGFEVPYAPFGFQSGMDTEWIPRRDAERDGIEITDSDRSKAAGQRAAYPFPKMRRSVRKMDPDILTALRERLRAQAAENTPETAREDEEAARQYESDLYKRMDIARGKRAEIAAIEAELNQSMTERRTRGTNEIFDTQTDGPDLEYLGDYQNSA